MVLFHFEKVKVQIDDPDGIKRWIKQAITEEAQEEGNLNFIFCRDNYLHRLNVDYLNHDTLTDVITFPMRSDRVEGDIFISIDRIQENAKKFEVNFGEELKRVMIHGVLHLMGFADKTEEDAKIMRAKENHYLSIFE